MTEFTSLIYKTEGRIAHLILNRPHRLNAIDTAMPRDIEAAVQKANDDDTVHAIVLSGAGKGFCGGYDLVEFAEKEDEPHTQEMPWDPMLDYKFMKANTDAFSSLWRSYKPTIAKIHGAAAAGGSDIALCCDIIIMAENARIGYPPTRVWGCPSTGMWVHRIGAQAAKRMLFTGDLVSGVEAAELGIALKAVPEEQLEQTVQDLAERIASAPRNQLMMQKLMINQAIEAQGMQNTQMIATLFDGITRHSPEGLAFKDYAEKKGFMEAVKVRDSGRPLPDDLILKNDRD